MVLGRTCSTNARRLHTMKNNYLDPQDKQITYDPKRHGDIQKLCFVSGNSCLKAANQYLSMTLVGAPCAMDLQPSNPQGWKNRSAAHGSFNERAHLAYQRSKLAKKPLGVVTMPGPVGETVDEVENHTITSMLESDMERIRQPLNSVYQTDWRSESSPHLRIRTLSGKQRGQEQTRCVSQQMPLGLSVVSAPVPLSQRLNAASMAVGFHKLPLSLPSTINNRLRSARSKYFRGASNSMHMQQLEMRENRAFVKN